MFLVKFMSVQKFIMLISNIFLFLKNFNQTFNSKKSLKFNLNLRLNFNSKIQNQLKKE
jgi:hypothetical protein